MAVESFDVYVLGYVMKTERVNELTCRIQLIILAGLNVLHKYIDRLIICLECFE